MRRSVRQLAAMVDDLFELAQLDAGAIETETARAVSARSCVGGRDGRRSRRRRRACRWSPTNGADDALFAALARVIQNLLVNAVRHTPADGTVRVEAHRRGDRCTSRSPDTGEGIAAEDIARVFDPFFRADPARSGAGAGLGLALAKRIVEALGGRISAGAASPVGARFAVEPPI